MARYEVHQTDANESRLVEYLKARGAQVEKIDRPVDLLICFQGATAVAEVKTAKGKLRDSQEAFLRRWEGIQAVLRDEGDCDWLLEQLVKSRVSHRRIG